MLARIFPQKKTCGKVADRKFSRAQPFPPPPSSRTPKGPDTKKKGLCLLCWPLPTAGTAKKAAKFSSLPRIACFYPPSLPSPPGEQRLWTAKKEGGGGRRRHLKFPRKKEEDPSLSGRELKEGGRELGTLKRRSGRHRKL